MTKNNAGWTGVDQQRLHKPLDVGRTTPLPQPVALVNSRADSCLGVPGLVSSDFRTTPPPSFLKGESRPPYLEMVPIKNRLDCWRDSVYDVIKRAPVMEGYKMGRSNQGECGGLLIRIEACSIHAAPAIFL